MNKKRNFTEIRDKQKWNTKNKLLNKNKEFQNQKNIKKIILTLKINCKLQKKKKMRNNGKFLLKNKILKIYILINIQLKSMQKMKKSKILNVKLNKIKNSKKKQKMVYSKKKLIME